MTLTESHDQGLAADFPLLRRRRLLGLDSGTTVASLAGLAAGETPSRRATDAFDGADDVLLAESGIVRSDIRRSFGKASGAARGVPLTVRLRLVAAGTEAPAAGFAVYLWHCDAEGNFSLYSPGLTTQNYLRGVQASDERGEVAFTTIVPGAAPGRRPQLNVEVYPSLALAGRLALTRIALTDEVVTGDGGAGFVARHTLAV